MFSFGQMIADHNRQIGITEGIDIGKEKEKIEIILSMIKANFSIETICQITEVSVEYVEKIMSE